MSLGGRHVSTLNCAVLFPRTPIRQLRSVPAPAFPLRKLRLRAVGVVCARNDSNAGVEKLGKASPGRGDGDGSPERVAEDPRLRLELKAKIGSLECNAQRARGGERVRGHTVGVDLGDAKTGLAISLGGYAPRPLTVVRQRGDKLLETILQVGIRERADEFVVGLPKAWDGKDSDQANKCRSFAGRLANIVGRRGWRVYLQDEYGTSQDALDYMIDINRRSRKEQLDAYAATALLCRYFESGGSGAQMVVPKALNVQQALCEGPSVASAVRVYEDDEDLGEFFDFDDE
uniref:YqgF/RNase H-like domain-containing protein n=1 Tax=Physcomitrium patens TaxID=3218 RepID=A0A7I4BRM2_PHYPA